jgi:hypothetical protein
MAGGIIRIGNVAPAGNVLRQVKQVVLYIDVGKGVPPGGVGRSLKTSFKKT